MTGGASGLGAAAAAALAREGARVILGDVDADAGEARARQIGEAVAFVRHDVRSEDAWQSVVGLALERHGRLDVLVNNAGIVVVATIEDTSLEQLRAIEAVNLEGPFLGCKHALPAMAAGGGGSIINIASTASLVGTPPFAAYSATKGGVEALTRTVAVHCRLRGNGVRCNSVHPGGMDTPMVKQMPSRAVGEMSPLALELLAAQPREPIGSPDEVAQAVLYLASDESRFVNGIQLAVDNGLSAA